MAAGVGIMVTISTRIRRLPELLALCEPFPNVFCSVGTHPHHADTELDVPVEEIVRLSQHPKVVAIGEAGLDYYYQKSSKEGQAEGFRRHIEAARITGLPLEIHTRDADNDTIRISRTSTQRAPSRRSCTATLAAQNSPAAPSRSASPCHSPASSPSRSRKPCARSQPRCRSTGCWSKPTRPTSRPSPIAARPTSRPTWCTPRPRWRRSRA